jgi:hypothetical protein
METQINKVSVKADHTTKQKQLPHIITTESELKEMLRDYSSTHNLLMPTVVFYNNHMGLAPVEINLDNQYDVWTLEEKDKEKHKNDDVWSADNGKSFTLTKHAMDKITLASGVAFKDSKVVIRELDEESKRVVYIKHNVYWEKPDLSGLVQTGISTGEYSYYEDLARFRYKNNVKATWDIKEMGKIVIPKGGIIHHKGEPITDQIDRRRNFAGGLAESNAKVRAFNEAICEFPKSFAKEELQKPFLLVRVVPDIEGILEENPDLRTAYNANRLGIANLIYGVPQTMQNQILIQSNVETNKLPPNETPVLQLTTDKEPEPKEEPNERTKMLSKIAELLISTGYKPKTQAQTMDDATLKQYMEYLEGLEKKSA